MKRLIAAFLGALLLLQHALPVAASAAAQSQASDAMPDGYAPSVPQPSTGPSVDPSGDPATGAVPTPLSVGLTSAAHPEASAAGMRILREGGSAVDATLAMMLALTVVEPQSSGIGGGGFLLSYDATAAALTTIDGRESAPAAVGEGLFLDENGQPLDFRAAFPGGRSVGVPGNIRLMAMAHKKSGKLPWKALFAPAIQLADGGHEVSESLAARLHDMRALWMQFPEAQKLLWQNNAPVEAGTLVYNPALARTFARIADLGPDAFYSGPVGQEIVRVVQGTAVHPGTLDLADLSAYAAKERPAVCLPYRTYKVCGMGPPSSGGVTVLQILGMLERFDLARIGPEDMTSWHLLAEAMRLAYADRDKYLADPDFAAVPVEGLLDPAYLKARSLLISVKKARADYPAGSPAMAEPRTDAPPAEVAGTSHFVAVDAAGNVASMTSTIEGPFGSQLVAAGFFLNNELTDFSFAPTETPTSGTLPAAADKAVSETADPVLATARAPVLVANRVQAGKRPLSSMSPVIVFDAKDTPVLTLGSAGGRRIIMHVAKTLIGVLDFGLPLDQAVAMPNIFFGGDGLLVEAGSGLAQRTTELAKFGHLVVTSPLDSKINGAQWTAERGWQPVADPRSKGQGLRE